jgi:hypothetical protein
MGAVLRERTGRRQCGSDRCQPLTMFIIDGAGNLLRIRRRPRDWERRETEEDCRFISENRRWDGDDRESVAKAIGLYDVMPNAHIDSERWLIVVCLPGAAH